MPLWEKYLGLPLLKMHDRIYQKTEGRIGHQFPGVPPSLLLHTVGARTGQPRTTTLSYSNDGNDYLVVASMGGAPRAPGWYFNLKKQPQVEINVGPRRFPVTARIVMPTDPDYDRLWDIVNRNKLAYGFKHLYGVTTSQFCQVLRMERAMQLLKTGQTNVAEAAEAVGYLDPGGFAKTFKKHFGFLPKDLLKQPAPR